MDKIISNIRENNVVIYMRVTIEGVWIDTLCFLDSLIQCVTTPHDSLLHTCTSVHSHVFISRCLVAAFNGGRFLSADFPNYFRPQLPSHSNSSQRLTLSSSMSLTNQLNSTDSQSKKSKSNLRVCYDRRSVGQSVLVSSIQLGLKYRFSISVRQLRVC
jgi:hypothetical protein